MHLYSHLFPTTVSDGGNYNAVDDDDNKVGGDENAEQPEVHRPED